MTAILSPPSLNLEVMGMLACFVDPESYIGGSSSPSRFNLAGQVKREESDEYSDTPFG